ncbi:pectate lyase [Micromonospora wenchangensis]
MHRKVTNYDVCRQALPRPVWHVDGGGARPASDKVFQHDGGGELTIRNFDVSNFGKLYRSCGNCSIQDKRTVVLQTIYGDNSRKISICDRYTGNSSGAEPVETGSGPDGAYCKYTSSNIVYK